MFRRVIAGLILGPALLLGSFAWWGFLALRTVFDESRTSTIAEELLENDEVVDQIGNNIGKALEAAMPESIQLSEAQVAAGVDIILDDPVVRDLIINAFGTTHRAFLGLDDAPAEIDLGPALESSRERIGIFAPTVAAELPEEFVVELPTERIPNASPVISFLERTVPLLAALSVTMALLAFLTTSDRSQVLGKAARWAIGTTAFYLIIGLGVPYLLRLLAPDGAEILAAFLTAILRAALIPSIVLGGIGAVLLLLSMFWPDPDRPRDEPASRRRREPTPVAAGPAPAPPVSAPPVREPRPRPAPAPARPASPPVAAPAPRPDPAPAPDATAAMPVAPVDRPSPAPPPTPPPAPPAPPTPAPDPAAPLAAPRPKLPTRAKPPEAVAFPAWTGDPEPVAEPEPVASDPPADATAKWRRPTWVEGHGWVMDPDDPRDPPNNARFVEGVGWVVPGPPPS
ncbi:MAG: hypothetical protein R8F63_00110 [Acidimicrobiales bacterium]|nr:hypothetical protein [Acidimicrobiales bacterium]